MAADFPSTGDVAAGQEEIVAAQAAQTEPGQKMEDECAALRQRLADTEDRLLRMAAEFENMKKRLLRDAETSLKYAEESLVRELLPTIDNLERALEQGRGADDVAKLLEGVDMTCAGLLATLEKIGLKSVDGAGTTFDPNFHEALAMEQSEVYAANTIIREYQKGYVFKDRLLRAARVVVSSGAA